MGQRGRPSHSIIRDNVVEILYFMGEGYGYEIYKAYKQIFPPVTLRVIYYHLKKGQEKGIFKVSKIKKTTGDYSWGGESEKIYYALDEQAKPQIKEEVKKFFEKKKKS